jgi:hypothetical protein
MVRLARVLFVDGIDERGSHGRAIALHDEADLVVDGRAQLRETRFGGPFAIEHDKLQRMRAVGKLHAPLCIHPLDPETQVALHGGSGIGKGSGHALDHCNADRRTRFGECGNGTHAEPRHDDRATTRQATPVSMNHRMNWRTSNDSKTHEAGEPLLTISSPTESQTQGDSVVASKSRCMEYRASARR